MEWKWAEVGRALLRGWKKVAAAGLIGVGSGTLAAYSPLATYAQTYLKVDPTPSKVLSGIVIFAVTLALVALVGAGFAGGRRYSLQYMVDKNGSCFVIAEYRGLDSRVLPLRLGLPPTQDPNVLVVPVLARASHGLGVTFQRENTNSKHTEIPSFRDIWNGQVFFEGGHYGSFDFVFFYRLNSNCAFDLNDHQKKWGDTFDDVEVDAKTAWDEIEIRIYWEREPKLNGDPTLYVYTQETKEPTAHRLDSKSPGMWSVAIRDVKPGRRLSLRWDLA